MVTPKLPPITLNRKTPRATELVGTRIAAKRKAMGLTQEDLAARTGISASTIKRLEAHGLAQLERVASALQVESHWLLYGSPLMAKPRAEVLSAPAGQVLQTIDEDK